MEEKTGYAVISTAEYKGMILHEKDLETEIVNLKLAEERKGNRRWRWWMPSLWIPI